MKLKRKIATLFLLSIPVGIYFGMRSNDAEYNASVAALTDNGVVVNATVTNKVNVFTGSKKDQYDFYYEIAYTDYSTGQKVKRFVSECEHVQEGRIEIACLPSGSKKSIQMLYVPNDKKMWTSCRPSDNQKDIWICSRSESTGGMYPPFTFEVERIKKQ